MRNLLSAVSPVGRLTTGVRKIFNVISNPCWSLTNRGSYCEDDRHLRCHTPQERDQYLRPWAPVGRLTNGRLFHQRSFLVQHIE